MSENIHKNVNTDVCKSLSKCYLYVCMYEENGLDPLKNFLPFI